MFDDRIIQKQRFRLSLLNHVYDLVDGNLGTTIENNYVLKKSLPETTPYEDFISGLIFNCQKGYIEYLDASSDGSPDMYLDIELTEKGLELVENLRTGENLDKFTKDFSPTALHSPIFIMNNSSNASVIFGDHNTQHITNNASEITELQSLIENLIEKIPRNEDLIEIKKFVEEEKEKNAIRPKTFKRVGIMLKSIPIEIIKSVTTISILSLLGLQ